MIVRSNLIKILTSLIIYLLLKFYIGPILGIPFLRFKISDIYSCGFIGGYVCPTSNQIEYWVDLHGLVYLFIIPFSLIFLFVWVFTWFIDKKIVNKLT